MENFFGILKQEIYYGHKFYTYEHLKQTIEDFIKYYNEERIKEKLGYLSPVEYRKKNEAWKFPTPRGRIGQRHTRASIVLTLVLGPTLWGHLTSGEAFFE